MEATVLTPTIRRRTRPGISSAETVTPLAGPAPVANAAQSAMSIAPVPLEAPPQADYDVGYGKPPKQHRFAAGQSGNPKGRPKGAKGLKAMSREQLGQLITLRIDGKPRKVRRIEAMIAKASELALKGDARALDRCLKLYAEAVPDTPTLSNAMSGHDPTPIDEPLDATDTAILGLYRDEILAEAKVNRERKGDPQ